VKQSKEEISFSEMMQSEQQSPAPPSLAAAVDPNRKQALLLEARRARVAWVDEVSMSCRTATSSSSSSSRVPSLPRCGDALFSSTIKSTKACESLKSAVDVISFLYGTNHAKDHQHHRVGGLTAAEAEERVLRQLESQMSTVDIQKGMIGHSAPSPPLSFTNNINDDQDEFETSFQLFLHKLRSPECAELVQGMRHFVSSMEDMVRAIHKTFNESPPTFKKTTTNNANDNNANAAVLDKHLEQIADAVRTYLDKTFHTILSHSLWNMQNTEETKTETSDTNESKDQMTKLALEAFIYARCHDVIWSMLLPTAATIQETEEGSAMDKMLRDKLTSLQFVTPAHLEIQCLTKHKTVDKEDGNKDGIDLSRPIQALHSLNDQYSPGQMLHCILNVYRGVNASLSAAVEDYRPSADDVLPTLILTVLRGKPNRIVSTLKFIELFASSDQLRGEAGYAYTNLYGAVQFLKDLKMDDDDDGSGGGGSSSGVSLHMSQDEFRAGLERCRAEAAKLASATTATTADAEAMSVKAKLDSSSTYDVSMTPMNTNIPIQEIRTARIRGEKVDLTWALHWQKKHANSCNNHTMMTDPSSFTENKEQDEIHSMHLPSSSPSSSSSNKQHSLPQGFTRSYNFLTAKPEDIRLSDLPQLLSEYRMLVHATESLLAEQTARENAEYKRQVKETRDRLELNAAEAAAGVDASKK